MQGFIKYSRKKLQKIFYENLKQILEKFNNKSNSDEYSNLMMDNFCCYSVFNLPLIL